MCILYLMRHGETDWNRERRWQAQLDVPLNATGRRQAEELGDLLAGVPLVAIYTSDLGRARETATILAGRLAQPVPVHPEPRLRELHAGLLAGRTLDEMRVLHPDWWKSDQEDPITTRPPGGETFLELTERVVAAADDIAARHPGRPVGVVSHGGPLKAVLRHILGFPGDRLDALFVDNCALTVVEWGPRPRLLALNISRRWLG